MQNVSINPFASVISYRPEVFVEGRWCSNSLRFATEAEARQSGRDMGQRWLAVEDIRAEPCFGEPVNYQLVGGRLVRLEMRELALA